MNPGTPPHGPPGHAQSSTMSLDDVLYTIFRHKMLILGFVCLGIAGAAAVRILRPPLYVSKAQLMVHYVVESGRRNAADAQDVRPTDTGSQAIIMTQVELFRSRDVAMQAVDIVGPAKILDALGGGTNRDWAAGVVASGIEIEPPRTSILTVSFKHADRTVAPLVLDALIQAYLQKSLVVYTGSDALEKDLRRQLEKKRTDLAATEEELRKLKRDANVLFVDETKKSYQVQIAKAQSDLIDAQRALAEQKALLGASPVAVPGSSLSNSPGSAVPSDTLSDYGEIVGELETLKKHERELLLVYKDAYPLVQTVRGQIEKLSRQKTEMEITFPSLAQLGLGGLHAGGTNGMGGDVGSQLAEGRRLEARVWALAGIMSNIQAQASQVLDMEPKITEVQRRRDEEQNAYDDLIRRLARKQNTESVTTSEANGISPVQSPTPAVPDVKKMMKLIAMVFAGFSGMGLGLAFLIDFVVDRTIKRSVDVERHLRLPVFLTIPDRASVVQPLIPPWLSKWLKRTPVGGMLPARLRPGEGNGNGNQHQEIAPWEPGHELFTYTEGLRERLMTYFEVNNLNLKKPKLVAVTGCNPGSGVTTLASGLAASLSKTGDGNVLLVDMNVDQGVAHQFYQGKPGCGLTDVLEPQHREEALLQENLYVATLGKESSDKLMKVMPSRFTHLVPKLKASDYDYIIFDMPPVSQTSMTPRLANYMDIVLMVLESEKTGQHSAVKASALMRESRANVAAILNKCQSHVPAGLSPD